MQFNTLLLHGKSVVHNAHGEILPPISQVSAFQYESIPITDMWRDVRTLVIYPASTLYLHSGEEGTRAAGVYDDTIRVSAAQSNLAGSQISYWR